MNEPQCIAFLTNRTSAPIPKNLTSVDHDGYTAVFGSARRLRTTRSAVLRDAAARMALLEQLMACGTVIPTLPHVVMAPDLAECAIRANRAVLDLAAATLQGRIQFQLAISCDLDAGVAHFCKKPALLGQVSRVDDLVARFTELVGGKLEPLVAESIGLPLSDSLIFNRTILVPAEQWVALDRVLEEIDALWTEGLAIRLTGPTPGVSHASLSMQKIRVREVKEALASLKLSHGARDEEISAARRSALLSGAASERMGRMANILRLAAAAGWPTGPMPQLSLWSESRAAPVEIRGAA